MRSDGGPQTVLPVAAPRHGACTRTASLPGKLGRYPGGGPAGGRGTFRAGFGSTSVGSVGAIANAAATLPRGRFLAAWSGASAVAVATAVAVAVAEEALAEAVATAVAAGSVFLAAEALAFASDAFASDCFRAFLTTMAFSMAASFR